MDDNKNTSYVGIIVGVVVVIVIVALIWGFFMREPREVLAPTEENLSTTTQNINIPTVATSTPSAPQESFDFKG